MKTKLRACASCEWIFNIKGGEDDSCPKCGFASYRAKRVYGDKSQEYHKTQKPWFDTKMFCHEVTLKIEISKAILDTQQESSH